MLIYITIIITITMAIFAAMWKTDTIANKICKLWMISLTVAGALCISYLLEKGPRIDTEIYLWCSSVTIWLFALTWRRTTRLNFGIKVYLFLLSVYCIIALNDLYA